jgi:FMN phosphatase YigB (HAD superfamily)
MKIMVEVNGSYLGIDSGENAGALLQALSTARSYLRDWQKDVFKQSETDEKQTHLSVFLVRDAKVLAPSPLIEEVQAAVKISDQRWLDAYQENQKLKKELMDLKNKIATLTNPPAPPVGPPKSDGFLPVE